MSLTDTPTGIAVTNPQTGDSTVQIGVTASLTMAIVNNSGAAIPLTTGAQAPTFAVNLPSAFFTVSQMQAIKVAAGGWTGTFDQPSLTISVACTQAGMWADGGTLTFTLTGVVSDGPPGLASVTVTPSNFSGNVALYLTAQLAVASPPKPGNLQLPDVLQVTLDSQGSVLRSAVLPGGMPDPLTNTLYLTLKNVSATALATGSTRAGTPQVFVSFVYGATSGALTPTDPPKGLQVGSAWNITAAIEDVQSPWTATNPRPDGEEPYPQWVLTPSPTNLQILGPASGDQANVTFTFSNLVSFTPLGHTQMFVLCTGFAKDAQTMYDDHLFVLDIVKLDPPPTRGLLSFFGTEPVIPITDPNAPVVITLRWAMLDVASVQLLTSNPAVASLQRTYAIPPKPLYYDSATVTLPAPQTSEAIFMTLQAFNADAGHGYLNSQQFTAYMQVSYVIDAAGNRYPIALFGSTFWMLQNYSYPAAGTYDYGDQASNEATFGRLYTAQVQPPEGWSLPTVADWTALFNSFGDASAAYTALIAGGRSGFNAQLGGQRDGSGTYTWQYQYGSYWAAPGNVCAQFSGNSRHASVGTPISDPRTALSVRFVRHV